MGALIDLTGRTFGMLTVSGRLPDAVTRGGARQPVWGCVCACGRRTVEQGRALRSERALSCRQCVRDPSRMLKYGSTYIAYWPTLGILKIGRAFRGSRLEMLRRSGAHILLDARGTDATWEAAGLRALRRLFDPAFTGPTGDGPHRADRILFRGRGWSECFFVEPEDLQLAYDECLRAFALEGNDIGTNPPATPAWRRALDAAHRSRAARRSRADRSGPPAAGGGEEPPTAQPHSARSAAVPDRADQVSDGAGDPARRDAGGSRTPVDMDRGRPGVAVHDAAVERAASGAQRPAGALIFTGWGERGRRSTRASESARARAGAGGRGRTRTCRPLGRVEPGSDLRRPSQAGSARPAGCSAHRLPGSPQRSLRALRALRHGCGQAPGVPRSTHVPRAVVHLRGADRGRGR